MINRYFLSLALFTTALGLLFAPTSASASLIGDSATVEVSTGATSLGSQTETVDSSGTAEYSYFTGPDNVLSVDIESSTIEIVLHDDFSGFYVLGTGENPITIEITDLDWVGESGTIVGASLVGGPSAFGETVQVTGPNSVEVVVNANSVSAGGDFLTILVQLETTHSGTVGGEFMSIDNTALMLAGIQSSAIWMIPTLAGIAGAGAIFIRLRMNKN